MAKTKLKLNKVNEAVFVDDKNKIIYFNYSKYFQMNNQQDTPDSRAQAFLIMQEAAQNLFGASEPDNLKEFTEDEP